MTTLFVDTLPADRLASRELQTSHYEAIRRRLMGPQPRPMMRPTPVPKAAPVQPQPTPAQKVPVMMMPDAPRRDVIELNPDELDRLRQYQDAVPVQAVKFKDIEREICLAYRLSPLELWSSRRQQNLCDARQEAYYRLRHETSRSMPDIARRCGGRDHTTILHGVRKIERLLATRTWRLRTLPDVTGHDGFGYTREATAVETFEGEA